MSLERIEGAEGGDNRGTGRHSRSSPTVIYYRQNACVPGEAAKKYEADLFAGFWFGYMKKYAYLCSEFPTNTKSPTRTALPIVQSEAEIRSH